MSRFPRCPPRDARSVVGLGVLGLPFAGQDGDDQAVIGVQRDVIPAVPLVGLGRVIGRIGVWQRFVTNWAT